MSAANHTPTATAHQAGFSPGKAAQSGSASNESYTLGWATCQGNQKPACSQVTQVSLATQWTESGGVQAALAVCTPGSQCGGFAARAWVDSVTAHTMPLPLACDFAENTPQAAQHALAKLAVATHLNRTNAWIEEALHKRAPGSVSAATTVGVWLGANGLGWVNHVGNCRAYHLRSYRRNTPWVETGNFLYAPGNTGHESPQLILTPLTDDLTYFNLRESSPPCIAPFSPARTVGNGNMGQPLLTTVHLHPTDLLLLGTASLHHAMNDGTLVSHLHRGIQRGYSAVTLGKSLLRLARLRGCTDDVGVLLVQRVG